MESTLNVNVRQALLSILDRKLLFVIRPRPLFAAVSINEANYVQS